MRRTLFILSMVVALAMLGGSSVEVKAACPSVSCEAGGNPGLFTGTFGCTIITTLPSGQVNVAVAQIVADGNGGITSFTQTTNNNSSSGSTFSAWPGSPTFTNGTYCLSPDQSGYITPPGSFGCPFAIYVDLSGTEVRLMDSTGNTAGAAVCELQGP